MSIPAGSLEVKGNLVDVEENHQNDIPIIYIQKKIE